MSNEEILENSKLNAKMYVKSAIYNLKMAKDNLKDFSGHTFEANDYNEIKEYIRKLEKLSIL